jgi:hypothetical protein
MVSTLKPRTHSADLRFVILKDVAQIWSQTDHVVFKELFYNMIQMKLRGYEAEYPAGVLPIDTTDFFGHHLLICEEKNGFFYPVSGIKSTFLSESQRRQLNFPALSLVQAAEAPEHIKTMKKILERCEKENTNICYTGSWTTTPAIRKNREYNRTVIRHFYALYVLFHLEQKVDEIITGGTMRFKADHFFNEMGHEIFASEGKKLEPIFVKHLFGEKVQLLHLKKFTNTAIKKAEEFRDKWNQRVEISLNSIADVARFLKAG